MESVKIGLVGLGVVGGGTFAILRDNAEEISRRVGVPIAITHIGARRDNPNVDTGDVRVSRDVKAVAEDENIDILIELIGGTGLSKELMETAINNGTHIVTANKALIAEHGNALFALAEANNVSIAYEAAVAGGIPIIKALREGLAANKINWLAGIINGTGNFILSEMKDKGREFDDVLAEAQKLGYAEADPTFDVEGIDAAHKLAILTSLAFGIPLQFDKVFTEGITRIDTVDVAYAEELGYFIKHLGIARKTEKGIEMRVHPTLIPKTRLIANVNGAMNAVLVHGDAVGPTLYYGAGAGSLPTASAVVADVVDIARTLINKTPHIPHLAFQPNQLSDEKVVGIEDITTAYYLRFNVDNKAGSLAHITQIFSDLQISIEAVIQKPSAKATGATKAEKSTLIIMTQRVNEGSLNEALVKIEALDEVDNDIMRIRVEQLS